MFCLLHFYKLKELKIDAHIRWGNIDTQYQANDVISMTEQK